MSAEVAILTVQLQVAETRVDEAETRADHAEARAEQAEARAKQAKSYAKAQVEQLVARAEQAEARADRAEARADRAEASCDRFILELGEQIRSIGQLREEFRIQCEVDRAVVERNLRPLLALHQSSFSELRGLKEKTSKSQRATSNRFRITPVYDGLPENSGHVSGRHNQATEEQVSSHFNHDIGKQASKTRHKRTYGHFKADETTITGVIMKHTMSGLNASSDGPSSTSNVWTTSCSPCSIRSSLRSKRTKIEHSTNTQKPPTSSLAIH